MLDELKGDKPDISYVRGMLETLISLQPVESVGTISMPNVLLPYSIPSTTSTPPSYHTTSSSELPPPPHNMGKILDQVHD